MPDMLWFHVDTLPEHFAHQIRDFVRILWFDAYLHDLDIPIYPADWHPQTGFEAHQSRPHLEHATFYFGQSTW